MNLQQKQQLEKIFEEIISTIRPTTLELERINQVIQKITNIILESSIPPELSINFIDPQGSTGYKQTSLHNDADIDLFIGLDPELIFKQNFGSKKKMREYLRIKIKELVNDWLIPTLKAHNIADIELTYAEHPYVSCKDQGIDIDLVICFDISQEYLHQNGPIAAVDRSPHHTRFIRDHFTDQQRDAVRILKYFLKNNYCYGDKSAVGRSGFIGYSIELLIAYYHDLVSLLDHFDELPTTIVTSSEESEKTRDPSTFSALQLQKYPNDFLIILDPTDSNRNVGSSISERAYFCIQAKVQDLIRNPSIKKIEKGPLPSISTFNLQEEERSKFFFVEYHEIKKDHYTKFRDKIYSNMEKIIRYAKHEQTLEDRFLDCIGELYFRPTQGIYALAFYVPTPQISDKFIRIGPDQKDTTHFEKFMTKNPEAFVEEGTAKLIKPRPYTQFLDFLQDSRKTLKVSNLKIVRIGQFSQDNPSEICDQSLGNLYMNILPFRKKYKMN